eukprot:4758269-Pleurochrysis_carterae.AAC.1
MADELKAAAQQAPPLMPREPVVDALHELADATAAPNAPKPPALSPPALDEALPAAHAHFLRAELSEDARKQLAPASFDPFPADRDAVAALKLPAIELDLRARALAVIEHVNRARVDPPAFARMLSTQLQGCFEGTTFNIPAAWGKRKLLRTAEGEAAVFNLVAQLKSTKPSPVLRLVPALSGEARQKRRSACL